MTDFVNNIHHASKIIVASCKVLTKIDWTGHCKIEPLTDKEIEYIGQTNNVEQYFKRFIEAVKDKVLKNISNINDVKWNVKGFDESIGFHMVIKEVTRLMEKFMKFELTKLYPQHTRYINELQLDINKTIIVEITKNNKTIFVATLSVERFI